MKRFLCRLRKGFADERGSSIATFLILLPTLMVIVDLVIMGARLAGAHAEVQSAARQSARQASVAQGPDSAATVIGPVVDKSLDGKRFECGSPGVSLGPGTNFVAGGDVEVEVSCTVNLSDLGFLPIPLPSKKIDRSATEPVDPFRVIE